MKDLETKVLGASSDALNALHNKIAQHFMAELGKTEVDIEVLKLVVKFLKDNEIKADPRYSMPLKQLQTAQVAVLPFAVTVEHEEPEIGSDTPRAKEAEND